MLTVLSKIKYSWLRAGKKKIIAGKLTSIILNPMFFLCSKTTGRSSRFAMFHNRIVLSYKTQQQLKLKMFSKSDQ